MKVHFLNVGGSRYGDCIVIQHDEQTILVDGAHPGDENPKPALLRTIPEQLEFLLGAAPHRISLLVVTHCHSDHIGCLPALVASGIIQVEDALVADEEWGFGHFEDGADVALDTSGLSETVRMVVAGLREEPRGINESNEALREFLVAADNLESSYGQMLDILEDAGTNVIRYRGQKLTALQTKYEAFQLKILGPTRAHLEICSRAIARYLSDAADIVRGLGGDAPEADAVALYRNTLLSGLSDSEDRPGKELHSTIKVLFSRSVKTTEKHCSSETCNL